jgi:RNA polymerase sigma-70 factor (TIGR02960 family)
MIPEDLRDPDQFQLLVQPFRRELAAHCYRMLGSLADAEDQVQETLLSAWRGIDGFEGRSSIRSWLYKIATNGCLDTIRRRPRRGLPMEHGAPAEPTAALSGPDPELPWIDPCPDLLWQATLQTPEATLSARESVQLAFIVALQHLPATQRSVLILREVVGWPAAEVAELLDTTVVSVNSALQRARATLDERRAKLATGSQPDEALLARYLKAWESGDLPALVALLHEDVVTTMPPLPTWFRGKTALAEFLAPRIGGPGERRTVRVACADQLAFAFYRKQPDGTFRGTAVEVMMTAGGAITELHVFLEPALLAHFGLPAQLDR